MLLKLVCKIKFVSFVQTEVANINRNKEAEKNDLNNGNISLPDEETYQIEAVNQMNLKHPLMYRWSLWYCKQDKNRAWEDCMKEVATFNTVEDFWS